MSPSSRTTSSSPASGPGLSCLGSRGQVMSMLQELIADAKAMEVEATHGEKKAQEDYEARLSSSLLESSIKGLCEDVDGIDQDEGEGDDQQGGLKVDEIEGISGLSGHFLPVFGAFRRRKVALKPRWWRLSRPRRAYPQHWRVWRQ